MNNIESRPVMLKIKEVPERFPGTTEHMIRQFVISGALPSVKVGKKYLICEQIISDFLLKGNNQANQSEQTQCKIRRLS